MGSSTGRAVVSKTKGSGFDSLPVCQKPIIMTKGYQVIRPDFSKNETVKKVKQLYADLYDEVLSSVTWNELDPEAREANRLAQRALDELETSAMYAVKALTV